VSATTIKASAQRVTSLYNDLPKDVYCGSVRESSENNLLVEACDYAKLRSDSFHTRRARACTANLFFLLWYVLELSIAPLHTLPAGICFILLFFIFFFNSKGLQKLDEVITGA
jgi:hypothetical protein